MDLLDDIETHSINNAALLKRIKIGASIGFVVITVILFLAEGKPNWEPYWIIRPLIVTPLTTAIAGGCTYFMNDYEKIYGWNSTVVSLLNIIGCFHAFWISIVLGLGISYWE